MSSSAVSKSDLETIEKLIGSDSSDILDADEFIKRLMVTFTANPPQINKKMSTAQLDHFRSLCTSTLSEIKVELLFTKDFLDSLYVSYDKSRKLPDGCSENTIKTLKAGKAIYTVLTRFMSPELVTQTKNHIKYSLYSLWQEILKVITPLDITTAVRAVLSLLAGNLFTGDVMELGNKVNELSELIKDKTVDLRVVWLWHNLPSHLKPTVEQAMIDGKTTFEQVLFQVQQQQALTAAKETLSTSAGASTLVAAAKVDEEPVHAMKTAAQYSTHGGNSNSKSTFKRGANQKERDGNSCRVCGKRGHTLESCWTLQAIVEALAATKTGRATGTTGSSNGNKA